MTGKAIDEMIKREKSEYHKKWRAENREKVKEYNQRYWRRRAEARQSQASE